MNLFENLLGAIQVGGVFLLSPGLRSWYNHWGAKPEDASRVMPGDELAPSFQLGYTRAIKIDAPAQNVWQWLIQLGQGRGGLYSYDGLENLIGCDIHTVYRIQPQLQHLQVDDLIRLGPKGYPSFSVVAIASGRSLVLVSANPKTDKPALYLKDQGKGYAFSTWQFYLESLSETSTRLWVRQRLDFSPDTKLVWRITEPIAFVMERKMLLTIKKFAEQMHNQ